MVKNHNLSGDEIFFLIHTNGDGFVVWCFDNNISIAGEDVWMMRRSNALLLPRRVQRFID